MEESVRQLFARYERLFMEGLAGTADMEDVATLYASEFIAASPAGVVTGRNDAELRRVMREGYERYRAIGTREMRMRDIRVSPMDDRHCVAHVAWTATYARDGAPDTAIDFDIHYLVQQLDGISRVFGWVSGDEQALLRQHGIV